MKLSLVKEDEKKFPENLHIFKVPSYTTSPLSMK